MKKPDEEERERGLILLSRTNDNNITCKIQCLRKNLTKAREYYKKEYEDSHTSVTVKGNKTDGQGTNYKFKSNEYVFYTFDSLNIGKVKALKEEPLILERKFFHFCDFINCNIQNIIFRRCCFLGCEFQKDMLFYVNFEDCLFVNPVIEKGCTSDDDAYYAPTIFENCKITSEFTGCTLDYVIFKHSSIFLSKFKNTSFENSFTDKCSIVSVEMSDCNLKDFTVNHIDMFDVKFTDEKLTAVNENTFIDGTIRAGKNDEKDIAGVVITDYGKMCLDKSKSVMAFSRLFEKNGYSDFEGEYFYQAKKAELKSLNGFSKFKSMIFYALCGWGERPSFTLLTILLNIVMFGIVYMFNGINAAGYIIDYSLQGGTSLFRVLCDYGKCLFFSITTFSTVGYGNYVPLGSVSMYAAGMQMLLGISLCALWTGCLFRKIAR